MGCIGVFASFSWFLNFNRKPISPITVVKVLLNGSICSSLANYLLILSYDYMSVGDVTSIHYYVSFASSLLFEIVFLKLIPHWLTVFCSLIGLLGMIFISQSESNIGPKLNAEGVLGFIICVFSGVMNAIFYIIMRKFTKVNTGLLILSSRLGSCILPLPWLLINNFEVPNCFITNRAYLMVGCGFITVSSFMGFRGSQLSFPSMSFSVKLLSIVLCYVMQVVVMNKPPHIYSVVGSALICLNILLQSLIVLKFGKNNDEN